MDKTEAIAYMKTSYPEIYKEIYRLVWDSRWSPVNVKHIIYNNHAQRGQILSSDFYERVELVAHQAWRDIPLSSNLGGLIQSNDDCLRG